jgi:Spy/CpxP family protein refolding chaperone
MHVPRGILRRAIACAALLLVAAALPASAQRHKWWQDERFQRELGLTAEQSARLEEIFQKHQPVLRQRMEALDQAQAVFNQVVEKGDDTAVMKQVDVVETARAELAKTRTLMLLRMRRSLTADQWAKFTALAQKPRNRQHDRPAPSR